MLGSQGWRGNHSTDHKRYLSLNAGHIDESEQAHQSVLVVSPDPALFTITATRL